MSSEDDTYGAGRRMRESVPEQLGRKAGSEAEPADPEGRRREITVIERDRILAQLQDKVIQRAFRAGLSLRGAAKMTADPEVRRLIGAATDELDHVIQEVRDAVFGYEQRDGRARAARADHRPEQPSGHGRGHQLRRAARRHAGRRDQRPAARRTCARRWR